MGQVRTSDGVRLHYDEAGSGSALVMIPGWSQTAAQFKHQLPGLSDRYRVIALDLRGHGESDKPAHGYRISRLAKDLHDALEALDLERVTLLGHSMGCSVIWCYWDLFGSERLAKLVLVDQMPILTANPIWSQAEREAAGCIFDLDSLYETVNALAGREGAAATADLIGDMLTSAIPEQEKSWIVSQNLTLPREYAARLLYDLSTADWRDTIPTIDIPTLVVSGRASTVPWTSQVWIHEQIAGSRLEIFEEAGGGGHFMFIESPDRFNRIVAEFIG